MKKKNRVCAKATGLLFTMLLFTLCSLSVKANTIEVSELTQAALQSAINSAASGDVITFNISGISRTITFTSTITLSKNLKIDGTNLNAANAGAMVFDGNNSVRLFTISSGKSVTIENVTMQNGHISGYGGAISNSGTLTISSSTDAECEEIF